LTRAGALALRAGFAVGAQTRVRGNDVIVASVRCRCRLISYMRLSVILRQRISVDFGLKHAPASKVNWDGMSIFSLCPAASHARVSAHGVFIT
jgi:hypothetical protein